MSACSVSRTFPSAVSLVPPGDVYRPFRSCARLGSGWGRGLAPVRQRGMSRAAGDDGGKRGLRERCGAQERCCLMNAKGSGKRLPPGLPQPPRQQLLLKPGHDFSVTRSVHPCTFFYHCMYPSISLPVLFYHHFHPSTPRHHYLLPATSSPSPCTHVASSPSPRPCCTGQRARLGTGLSPVPWAGAHCPVPPALPAATGCSPS